MGLTLADPESAQKQEDLTPEEQEELASCEARIERAGKAMLDGVEALIIIQRRRLYRATHGHFDDYCEQRLGISGAYAYDLMRAYEIAQNVQSCDALLPIFAKPSHALALRNVPAWEQASVYNEAIALAGDKKLTAAHIESVAQKKYGTPRNTSKHDYSTIVILPEPLHTRVVIEAEKVGVSLSEIVRRALVEFFGGEK